MSLARDVTTVGTATLLSRLLGFFRDVGIAAVLGAGVLSDAYFAALQIPNLFRRLLAEGALNSAFVPLWLRIREKRGMRGTRGFAERVLGTMVVGLGVLAIICVIFAPTVVQLLAPGFGPGSERYDLAVDFVRLSVPYIAIAGPVAVAAPRCRSRSSPPASPSCSWSAARSCARRSGRAAWRRGCLPRSATSSPRPFPAWWRAASRN